MLLDNLVSESSNSNFVSLLVDSLWWHSSSDQDSLLRVELSSSYFTSNKSSSQRSNTVGIGSVSDSGSPSPGADISSVLDFGDLASGQASLVVEDFTSEGSLADDNFLAKVSLDFSESCDSHLLLLDQPSHSDNSSLVESLSRSDSWSSSLSQFPGIELELFG